MRMKIFTRNGCIHLQQTTIRNVSPPAHTRSIERRMMCELPRELPQRQHVLATHDHRAHANRLPSSHQPAAPARHVPAPAPPRSRDARPPRAPEPPPASAPARRVRAVPAPTSPRSRARTATFPHPHCLRTRQIFAISIISELYFYLSHCICGKIVRLTKLCIAYGEAACASHACMFH